MKHLTALFISIWLGMQLGFGQLIPMVLIEQMGVASSRQFSAVLYHLLNYWGLFAWIFLLLFGKEYQPNWGSYQRRNYTGRWVLVLIALIACHEFLLTPTSWALKAGETHWLAKLVGGSAGMWHGTASVFYIFISTLGVLLCLRLLRLEWKL